MGLGSFGASFPLFFKNEQILVISPILLYIFWSSQSRLDQQNKALEAATVTLRYFMALCPPMGKTREIFDLHFLAKPGFFQANYCDVTIVVLTCNMRNEFVAVRVYQAVKNPATTDEFAADFSLMSE